MRAKLARAVQSRVHEVRGDVLDAWEQAGRVCNAGPGCAPACQEQGGLAQTAACENLSLFRAKKALAFCSVKNRLAHPVFATNEAGYCNG